jgi:predicted DNA-binding transcriptional regulator YafY
MMVRLRLTALEGEALRHALDIYIASLAGKASPALYRASTKLEEARKLHTRMMLNATTRLTVRPTTARQTYNPPNY